MAGFRKQAKGPLDFIKVLRISRVAERAVSFSRAASCSYLL